MKWGPKIKVGIAESNKRALANIGEAKIFFRPGSTFVSLMFENIFPRSSK